MLSTLYSSMTAVSTLSAASGPSSSNGRCIGKSTREKRVWSGRANSNIPQISGGITWDWIYEYDCHLSIIILILSLFCHLSFVILLPTTAYSNSGARRPWLFLIGFGWQASWLASCSLIIFSVLLDVQLISNPSEPAKCWLVANSRSPSRNTILHVAKPRKRFPRLVFLHYNPSDTRLADSIMSAHSPLVIVVLCSASSPLSAAFHPIRRFFLGRPGSHFLLSVLRSASPRCVYAISLSHNPLLCLTVKRQRLSQWKLNREIQQIWGTASANVRNNPER